MSTRTDVSHSLRRAAKYLPHFVREFVLDGYYFTVDAWEGITRKRDALTPPKRLIRISTSPNADFKATGRGFLHMLVEHCELQPSAQVLDVGCGVGRVAVALTTYLDRSGRYEGFDIVPAEIRWCQENVTPSFPNFRFRLADIYSKAYHPKGSQPAAAYRFPYADATFDCVFLASVFTHLLTDDLENYLAEISRVLKPSGRSLISLYLLNARARQDIAAGLSVFQFEHRIKQSFAQFETTPELAVAYDEAYIRDLFGRHGLAIIEPIRFGTWSRSKEQGQDLVILQRSP